MGEFTPIRKALTLKEQYEIQFEIMNNNETRIRFYNLDSVYQITMHEMLRYELHQDRQGLDHLDIESLDGSTDYFLRLHGGTKWKYTRSSTVLYDEYISYLKHDLLSTIDAYRPNFCVSPEENYSMLLESVAHELRSFANPTSPLMRR